VYRADIFGFWSTEKSSIFLSFFIFWYFWLGLPKLFKYKRYKIKDILMASEEDSQYVVCMKHQDFF
jgi:hypothetical protein